MLIFSSTVRYFCILAVRICNFIILGSVGADSFCFSSVFDDSMVLVRIVCDADWYPAREEHANNIVMRIDLACGINVEFKTRVICCYRYESLIYALRCTEAKITCTQPPVMWRISVLPTMAGCGRVGYELEIVSDSEIWIFYICLLTTGYLWSLPCRVLCDSWNSLKLVSALVSVNLLPAAVFALG